LKSTFYNEKHPIRKRAKCVNVLVLQGIYTFLNIKAFIIALVLVQCPHSNSEELNKTKILIKITIYLFTKKLNINGLSNAKSND
jgi:hypothetical protein